MSAPLKSARFPVLAGVCFLLAAIGCATVGHEFPVDPVSQITIGETTRAEIEEQFGPPWRVGIEDGMRTWTYGHYRYKLFGEAKTRDLVLRFDDRGVVTSYTYNSTDLEDEQRVIPQGN